MGSRGISLRSRIFIFYAGILLASLSVFTVLTIRISNQAILDKAIKNAERELSLIDKSLLSLTNNSENYIRILSTDNRLQSQLEHIRNKELDFVDSVEVERTLSTVISSNVVQPITNIAAASIISAEREFFEIGFVDNSSIRPVFNDELLDRIVEKRTPTWTGLLTIKYNSAGFDDVFALAKPIIGFDTGHNLGTAIIYLKEKDVASIYLDNMTNQEDRFFIVDGQMNIISTQDKEELYKRFDEGLYLGDYKLEEVCNKSIIRNIRDKQSLVTVQDFTKLNWKIVSIIPLDEITNENKGITKLIVILGTICLVCAFVASFLISYTISKPILRLVSIMKEIKSGDLKLRADLDAQGEIGMLAEGFNSLMDRVNELLEQIYDEQKEKQEYEFKLIQSQIKPHFLYNTVETIISFIKLGLKDNAMLTAKYLAGFYRISLSKGNDIISIKDEMNLIENYLSIQKLRYVEYLDFHLDFKDEILKYRIPKLTLQPLVENSIYHGLKQKEGKGILTIKGYFEQGLIKIEVCDNGVGMNEEQIVRILHGASNDQKSTDFGIHSVDARLKLLYGAEYGLSIESRISEYTKVTVRLPAVMGEKT